MQDIFREAELSPGAVYSYFKGKDELIGGIIGGGSMGFVADTAALFGEPLPEGRLRRPGEALAEMIALLPGTFELGTGDERARSFRTSWASRGATRGAQRRGRARVGAPPRRASRRLVRAAQDARRARSRLDPE